MTGALRRRLRGVLSNLKTTFLVCLCRRRFPSILNRLRAKVARGEKLRVYFIVSDISKWKCQSVYNMMRESAVLEPIVAIMMNEWEQKEHRDFNRGRFEACRSYFSSRGMAFKTFFDLETETFFPLKKDRPDIVFFQQPWYSVKGSMPLELNQDALTCYVPYFVANYVNTHYDCCQLPHRYYHLHFVLNEQLVEVYKDATAGKMYAGEFVPVGHPALDGIRFCCDAKESGREIVIYAPHWSLKNCGVNTLLHYATFGWNGVWLLEYACRHPEVKWAFKPHPALRNALVSAGLMSKNEVEAYYRAWGDIGIVSETAGYEELFNSSKALVTDCGSFLTEYAVTGMPIIHMLTPCSEAAGETTPLSSLYKTYYRVRSLSELEAAMKIVVEERQDPRCSERLVELEAHRLSGNCASENIMRYLEALLGVKLCKAGRKEAYDQLAN